MNNVKNGKILTEKGTECWYIDGKLHRADGPAVIRIDGTKEWYQNDKPHREDGPAVEGPGDHREWWINGVRTIIENSISPAKL
jgi:hypothetical protein